MSIEDNGNNNFEKGLPNKVHQLHDLISEFEFDGWNKCWEKGVTPWDYGRPLDIIVHMLQTGALPNGRALVPGCGSGYDVEAMACPERYVIGLDISKLATQKSIERFISSAKVGCFAFITADFFTWQPNELFYFIFDYTFFCSFDPKWRLAWAQKCKELLKPGGELITLISPISNHVGGPPFGVSVSQYEEVLHRVGFRAISIDENEHAQGNRKGFEKLGRWKLNY